MQQIVVGVGGMSCQGCVKTLTGILSAVPGVERAEVALEAGLATIVFDPEMADVAMFRQAIEDAGFDVL